MKTLVIGASTNPERYAYKAIVQLLSKGHEVIAYGQRKGVVNGVEIETAWNPNWQVDTVTLYINPSIQAEYYDRIIALSPRRVIFNPGTENPEFYRKLEKNGIESQESCTLVMLSIGNY